MATMGDHMELSLLYKNLIVKFHLRVRQNSFLLFFELEVAQCFYVSRSLFPDFGYSKLKCAWYMKINFLNLNTKH